MNETTRRSVRGATTDSLRRESERLRIEFANTDLDVAMTFVRLARIDLQAGDREIAVKLIGRAEYAADEIAEMLDSVTSDDRKVIRARLPALASAVVSRPALVSGPTLLLGRASKLQSIL